MATSKQSHSNETILIEEELPQIEKLNWQELSAAYAPLNLLINIIFFLTVLVLSIAIYAQPWLRLPVPIEHALPYFISLIIIIGILSSVLGFKGDKRKKYALRELDLHFFSGLIFCKIVSQPITRVQHVELKRGPFERRKGLASLQVFSAGGSNHTFEIPGLALATAQKIRQFILQHKDINHHG